jgi:peptidoglycan/xylan/chitin deacetylase (PgdA/CDA1 family)
VARRRAGGLVVAGAVGAGAGSALVHVLPALTTVSVVRQRLTPRLAGVGRAGHVALTFDDGPDPASTPAFLAALDDLGWTATFFLLGHMTRRAPGLAAEIAAAGHEVAVHGDEHRSMLWRRPARVVVDVARARDAVVDATGTLPRRFRPPFGMLSAGALRAARRCELDTVLWTAWGRDWRPLATAASVAEDVLRGRVDGGTVLLHDSDCTSSPGSWRAALGALPRLAEAFARRDLAVGPLTRHFCPISPFSEARPSDRDRFASENGRWWRQVWRGRTAAAVSASSSCQLAGVPNGTRTNFEKPTSR